MADLDRLMWKREYLPVHTREIRTAWGSKMQDFGKIEIPPHHPFMKENGIDLEIAASIIDEAIENTFLDFKGAEKNQVADRILASWTGKHGKPEPYDSGIIINPFPVTGTGMLYIGRFIINPGLGECGAVESISIRMNFGTRMLEIPKEVSLPEELKLEYEMANEKLRVTGKKSVDCPYTWDPHNLSDSNRILYKNLVMAIDNEVVRRKYSK